MSVKTIIAERRSTRKYQDKEIPANLIKEVVDAARLAPSGNNAQPSRFFIVKDEKIKKKLKEEKVFKQDFVYKAPVIIVCCGDTESYPKEKLEPGFDDPFRIRAVRDVSIAAQNLVLRATELGLGTCYIGWRHKGRIKKALGIPKNYVVPFVITLGYPAESPEARPRKSLKEILFFSIKRS